MQGLRARLRSLLGFGSGSGLQAHYLRILKNHKATMAGLLLGSLVAAATLGLALPIVILKITDEGVINRNLNALLTFFAVGLAALLVNALSRYLIQVYRARLRNSVVREVSLGILEDFYRLPYKTVLQKDRGYFLARMWDETPRAVEPFLQLFIDLSVTGLSMLASLGVVFYLSWRVGLAVCVGVPAFLLLSRRISGRIRQSWKEVMEGEANSKGFLERLIGGHRVVNVFAMQRAVAEKYDRVLKRQIERLLENARFIAVFGSLGTGFVNVSALTVLGFSGFEVIHGRMTLGGMIAITNIYGRMIAYAQELVNALPNLQNARVTLERLSELRTMAEADAPRLTSGDGAVVSGMGFAYDEEEICRDLNLTIRKGERVLVLGSNGTGKTTLAHVLAGVLRPTSGSALVPERISAAFFPPVFIPGSIAENVSFDSLDADKRRLFSALAERFELQDLIEEDPGDLSAGQRQKASLMRALLRDADLYIFDEPFANVDQKTKAVLFETLLENTRGKSLLIIMHGEEQLHSEFDQVIDLDRFGSHLSKGPAEVALASAAAAGENAWQEGD